MKRTLVFVYLAVLACLATSSAQVQTQTKEQVGTPTTKVEVQRAEVVYVEGNDLVVKTPDGQLKHIVVPEGVTATVDGKELGVQDLKPGMKLQRTVTTTTTPRTVTTVKTVEGTVFHVSPPNSVILRMADGTNQKFRIPKDQKFTVDGRETDAFGLREGMKVSATAITEVPETVVAQQIKRTGEMPPAPETPPIQSAMLIVVPVGANDSSPAAQSEPAPAAAEPAPATQAQAQLPQTASFLPLLGMLGVLFSGSAVGMKLRRK